MAENTYAVKEWSLCLGGTRYLHHVLFMPNMNCTLIFVAKILHELNCTITFAGNFCVIQDQTLRTLIGAGEMCGGVYQFRAVAASNKVDGISEHKLWHRRLAHPSKKILLLFPKVRDRIASSDLDTPCHICFRAKQARENFYSK